MKVANGRERGSALLVVVVITILIVGIAGAYLALTGASSTMTTREVLGLHSLYCAETGAAVVISEINAGQLIVNEPTLGQLPAAAQDGCWQPADNPGLLTGNFGNGSYRVTVALWGFDGVDNDSDGAADDLDQGERSYITVTSTGDVSGEIRQVECILSRVGGGVFWNAIYAGNSSNTAGYSVTFKGTGKSADYVQGDTYINGSVNVQQQANLNGNLIVSGTASDTSSAWSGNWENGLQPLFDINQKNYPSNHDVSIAQAFSTGGATYGPAVPQGGGTSVGGNAWQLPSTNPAHIFRKNPSDRTGVYPSYSTVYALEDPYERLQTDPNWNGTDATKISFTSGYEHGKTYFLGPSSSSDKVVMIIDNTSTYSYKFNTPGAEATGQQILIVVQGDIVIGDNIFMTNQNKDAVVFIALKNPDGTGGNIYFGDPRYGTVEDFNAYMFAENNFISTNVSNNNSKILVHGNMAAGNKIQMNLDGTSSHHKWEVVFDPRLKDTMAGTATGARSLDGIADLIPPNPTVTAGDYGIVSWRQISPRAKAMDKGYQFPP